MKRKVRFILLAIGIISCSGIFGQNLATKPTTQLPSEKTLNEINQTYQRPELRAKPPGGGPAIGEVITPIGDLDYTDLLIAGFLYAGFLLVKRKAKFKRGIF